MTADEILLELKALGSEAIRKVLARHGAREPLYGVKVEDLKKIRKRVKTDYQLALDLYATGVSDAMYLAGLVADDARMTKKDLQRWADQAPWSMISEYTVAWVAAGSPHGPDMALKWIDAKKPNVAASGWATLASLAAVRPDEELDLPGLEKLLERVEKTIHQQPGRIPYVMNGFVIAVGCHVVPLTKRAEEAARKIGRVEVDMGETACQVPSALEYIDKVRRRGTLGKKRKAARC